MTLTQRQEASALVVVAVFAWSFPGVFVRFMPHLSPVPLVAVRMAVACIALAPFAFFGASRANTLRAIGSWKCWLLAACMLIYYVVATPAFLFAPIGEVALVIASAPLFAVLLRLMGRQPVTRNEVLGAGLAVSGVLLMSLHAPAHPHANLGPHWIGILLSVMAALAAAVYAIGNRHLVNQNESPGAISQVWLSFCLGLLLIPSLFFLSTPPLFVPKMGWAILLGAFSTALPTVAVAATSHRIHPVAATMINPLTAICATVVAALIVPEIPSPWALAGGALVIAAVYIAMRRA
ncbi:MAG TPA: DMT family transporter [Fimbriimonas sp.]|nr:DMT family transporter [Fimbriimonas sp.]